MEIPGTTLFCLPWPDLVNISLPSSYTDLAELGCSLSLSLSKNAKKGKRQAENWTCLESPQCQSSAHWHLHYFLRLVSKWQSSLASRTD